MLNPAAENSLFLPLKVEGPSDEQASHHLVVVVLYVENMMRKEQDFVNMRDEISLLQSANKTTHRNVICKQNTYHTRKHSQSTNLCQALPSILMSAVIPLLCAMHFLTVIHHVSKKYAT